MTRFGTITSWFKLPEQGMTTFEVLGRATATAFPWLTKLSDYNLDENTLSKVEEERKLLGGHLVTSCHSVYPFLYPHFYPAQQDWLCFVRPQHVKCTLEVRFPDGTIEHQWPLAHRLFAHSTRDILTAHLNKEALDTCEIHPFSLLTSMKLATMGETGSEVTFHGHEIDSNLVDGNDVSFLIPHQVSGTLENDVEVRQMERLGLEELESQSKGEQRLVLNHHRTIPVVQTLAKSEEVLEMGMCGGPAVHRDSGACVGIVEGVVQSPGPWEGHAAVVPFQQVCQGLLDIEQTFIRDAQ